MSCSVCEGTGTGDDPCPKCGNIPMPADLKNPFAESCCDGGACSTAESAQPCGCDMGTKPYPHYCNQHRDYEKYRIAVSALEDILTADETSTLKGALAIAQWAIDEINKI